MGVTFPQTTVSSAPPAGLPGMPYDLNNLDKDSAVNADTVGIPFGVFVGDGASKRQCIGLTATTQKLKGVMMREQAYSIGIELIDNAVQPKAEGTLAVKGRVWVQVEGTVTEASQVHVRCVATTGEVAGAVRATKDGSDTLDISGFARFINGGGTAATGAVLEFDLSNRGLAVADS